LKKKVVNITLGKTATQAAENLIQLNRIFLDESLWRAPPLGTSDLVTAIWAAPLTVDTRQDGVVDGGETVPVSPLATTLLLATIEEKNRENLRLQQQIRALTREVEHWRGRRVPTGPSPQLAEAAEKWIAAYQGRDPDHMQTVAWEVRRFVRDFGPKTLVEEVQEGQIATWLRGITRRGGHGEKTSAPLSPGRRNAVRLIVLRFLEDSGGRVERKLVPAASAGEVRAKRGPVRWLERDQAEALAGALPEYWRDVWRVQVGLGLRPSELLALHRQNFSGDLAQLTLAPLGVLTLKTGSRAINVPEPVREILRRRFLAAPLAFPRLDGPGAGREPWTPAWFYRSYRRVLREAAARMPPPGIGIKLDARAGRRTCGSLLLRAGMPLEAVAAILGDDPNTIREHYARILAHEVDPSAAAI
jgi:integrase